MKQMNILLIAGAVVIVIIVLAVLAGLGALSVIMFDLMSGTATGSETLSPTGSVTGHALVVYNPGVSGAAKNLAFTIANDLKAEGYSVVLAGVKSQAAADVSGYDIIVVGGPVYAGSASSSIKAYLEQLNPAADAKVGVFGHGSVERDNGDQASVAKDVASLPADNTLEISAALKLTQWDDMDRECADFVDMLLG